MRVWGTLSSCCLGRHFLFFCAAASGIMTLAAQAQTPSPSAAVPALQSYTAPDQSAQAGVPPGWKVTKGAETVIVMDGPKGEEIVLGNTFVVRNAPLQLGQKPANGIDLSMPNSASMDQKFTMLEQWGASVNGSADPQVKIASSTPFSLMGGRISCGRVSGSFNSLKGPVAFGLLICSLPVDTGGTYKLMMKLAQAPPDVASQEKALAGAVFASYRIPPAMVQKKFAPHFAPPPPVAPAGSGAPGMSSTIGMLRGANDSAECMDLGVIREEPNWQLPRKCGCLAPND